jgi:molybdopterin adenylyltransferase
MASESTASHMERAAAHAHDSPIRCAVLTVSDTRTLDDDESGRMIATLLADGPYTLADRAIVPDDPALIRGALERWLDSPAIDAVLTTGGTGIARRDTTVEVVRGLLTAELEGFGELFRMLSWSEVGAAAMLSRAVAGLVSRDLPAGRHDVFVFAMPGSTNAVQTAMAKLIVPQLSHLVWERRR